MLETNPDLRNFYGEDIHIGIVSVDDSGQGQLLRSLIENMGAIAHWQSLSTPGRFLEIVSAGEFPSYFVVSCHGDDNGLCFGDFAEGIDVSTLVRGSLPSKHIAEQGALGNTLVINTACGGGKESMAQDFLSAGARGYIGTDPDPKWTSMMLFLHHFFHETVICKSDDKKAWLRAASFDDESRSFLYYDQDGCIRA